MRTITLVVSLVLFALLDALPENVTVIPNPTPCSPQIRLTIRKNGVPAQNMPVKLYREGQEIWAGRTDANAVASFPKLARGVYRVEAGDRHWSAELYLNVARKKGWSAFDIDLIRIDGLPATAVPRVGLLTTLSTRIKDFHGTVVDPTGAPIPQTAIYVYRENAWDGDPLLELSTDNAGGFDAHLESGIYVAAFVCPGFQRRVLTFEVTASGKPELHISLDVGHS